MMTRLLQWKWEILAPVFGVMMTSAFAPYDYPYALIIALLGFFSFCLVTSRYRALWRGYLFGLGLFGTGIWWVYVSIHDFGGGDSISSTLLTMLLVMLWSLFPALTAFLISPVLWMTGVWLRILAIPLIWVAVEYFRGYWLLNGFPWLQIAYSQLDTPLSGYAALIGVYGIGFLLAASAMVLFEIWRKKLSLHHGLIFGVLIWGGGVVLQNVEWTEVLGQPIKVTLVQGNIDQAYKWQTDQMLSTLKLYQQLTEQHLDSDVIIWPETAIPAFLEQVKSTYLEPLAKIVQEHGVDLVVSLPSSGEGNSYYNSVISLANMDVRYHKNHLLPFGEYLPLQPLSGWVLDQLQIPLGDFAAGDDMQPLLKAGGYAFVTTICYEDAFAELVNRQVEHAAFLVNLTNDAWFGDTAEPHQHMQIARMRAIETGRYLLRATNTGLTGFVAPNGKIVKQAPLFTTTTLTDTITPMQGLTPYAKLGDRWVFVGMLGLVLAAYGLIKLKSKF